MSPVRKPAVQPITVEVERREVDDPHRAQAFVRLLAEIVAKQRARQR